MSYQLVEDLQKKAGPQLAVTVSQACRLLDVSRSGYYASAAAHQPRLGAPVVCAASVHLRAAFTASHKAYGSRRLTTAMAERGLAMGRHRVRTLMRLNGLRPVWRRKFVHTTDNKHTMAVLSNETQPTVCASFAHAGLGLRYHLYPHAEQLAVSSSRTGLAFAQDCGLGHV